MHPWYSALGLGLGLSFVLPAPAQSSASSTVVVTGNPLGRDDLVQPASVLAGDALAARRAGTLGQTLDGLPGVASTGFGPNVGRPVVRGLDGDRVRLLDNGGASVDASNLSFDHAVAIDPLAVERVEVLRGPAALLYGGNATGGAVNTIDNRIPRVPQQGLAGRAEVRLGGAADERAASALVEGGAGAFAWHADGFKRRSGDQRVPEYTPIEDGQPLERSTRVRNSAADAEGGAVGAGWAAADGFAGAAIDTLRNRYGVTAEPDVFIRMRRDRLQAAGERRGLAGPIDTVSFQAGRTRYEHQEVEGSGEVGTTFKSDGTDLRLQARHRPLAGFSGAFGLQADRLDFSALGEEAFVPSTTTRTQALFIVEELALGGAVLQAGVRGERVSVGVQGGDERRFTPASASLGARSGGGNGWQWNVSLGHTERAPAYYELFADGVHVATGAYERGDTTLGAERSRHAEAGLGWRGSDGSVKLDLFDTRFSRFIALDATGATVDVDGTPFPEYAFRAVRARLRGAELEARWRVLKAPWSVDLTGGADLVRGRNLDSGEPLARLPPLRLRAGVEAVSGGWKAGAGVRHAATQDRVPSTDTATPGWTMLDLWAGWQGTLAGIDAQWLVKLDNATDRLATSAVAVATIRGLSPLPGRAVSASLRLSF